ncbi:slit homolog 3 protein-like [Coccinella septempunctata]|uniref:slit homolog 3 protein-like n=1 Tax=Coccinella septempunctata TaxID=41139 RepID=UPI001D06E614|nr:slit homolog 3 protein-like [Coccinella septempunctata]
MHTQKPNMDRYLEYMGLISIMLLSTAMAGCPSRCVCSKNAVKCSGKSLMNVPNFQRLENDPVTIDLSSNEIDFISYDDFSFDKVEVVQVLYLNESKIIDIDNKAFKELSNVREIYLARNLLGQLPEDSFEVNSKLILLDLSYNLFTRMPKIISQSLETLVLTNSGIEKIDKDNFAWIPNLKYLNLRRNNLKIIDWKMFQDVPQLRLIQLEFNRWKCTCKSVELFNFLQENSVLNIEEPIQCRSNDVFVSFFTENGAPEPIKDLCEKNKNHSSYNFVGNYVEPKEKENFNQRRSAKNSRRMDKEVFTTVNSETKNIQNRKKSDYSNMKDVKHHEFLASVTTSNYIIFSIAILLAFIVGLASGCLFVNLRRSRKTDNSTSCDSLLKRSIVI